MGEINLILCFKSAYVRGLLIVLYKTTSWVPHIGSTKAHFYPVSKPVLIDLLLSDQHARWSIHVFLSSTGPWMVWVWDDHVVTKSNRQDCLCFQVSPKLGPDKHKCRYREESCLLSVVLQRTVTMCVKSTGVSQITSLEPSNLFLRYNRE